MGTTLQIKVFLDALLSPLGLLAVGVYLVLLVMVGATRVAKWGVLSVLLYTATFGFYDKPWIDNTLVFPLEQLRRYARGIQVALLMALLIPVFASPRGWRRRLLLASTVIYLIFQMTYSTRLIFAGQLSRGVVGAMVYVLIFTTMGVGLSKWLQDLKDVHTLLRSILITMAIFIVATSYQLVVNPSAILINNRLIATTGNPQHTAVMISLTLPMLCYLLMQRRESKVWMVLWGMLAGFMVIFLLWSGSRTGLLMSMVGLGLLFRTRIGSALGMALACSIFVLIAWLVFSESTVGIDRFISSTDTRSIPWSELIQDFIASPLYGTMGDSPVIQENSYLSAAGRLGMIGMIPLLAGMVLCGRSLLVLYRCRPVLGENVLLADLAIGGLTALSVGAVFEGYLFATLAFPVFAIYIYLSIMTFVIDAVETGSTS